MHVELEDGRRLAYETFGPVDGRPVIHCHGWGDSRLTRHPDDSLLEDIGVRLITIDRPGVGSSTDQVGRTLAGWAADVGKVADILELGTFAVSGHSGGGPHALAIAAGVPERVTGVAIVCGWAPVDRPGGLEGVRRDVRMLIGLGRRAPWAVRYLLASTPKQYRRNPERAFAKQFSAGMPACDLEVLADEAIRRNILDGACESVRPGSAGLVSEALLLFARTWDLDLGAIVSPVQLWYGAEDTLTPPHMGEWVAGAVADADLHVVPGQGHLLLWTRWVDILGSLTR